MKKEKAIILLLSLGSALFSFGQHTITGVVVDAKSRQPLEAASVGELDQAHHNALTDAYGRFSLSVQDIHSLLRISSVGYKTLQIAADSLSAGPVGLERDLVNLKDVVVLSNMSAPKFSTLSRIDLDLHPVDNTQQLMRLVPGLFIAQHAGGGKAEQIFLRGFDCDHGTDIQVSADGIPVNMVSHAHGQGYADAHFIIPETIHTIDYGAGPYYPSHGNLNTAGFINFSTYTNIDQSRVQLEGGQFNTFRALALVDLLKANKDKQSAYVAGEYFYTNGPTDNPQKFNRVNLFGKYNLALDSRTHFTATLSHFASNWDASGQVPERAVREGLIDRFGSIDPSEGGNTQRSNINLILSHRFANGGIWDNQAYYSRYLFNLYSNFTFYLTDTVNGDEINQAEARNLVGYQSRYTRDYDFARWSLHSVYGAGFRYDGVDSSKLAHVVKRQFLGYDQLGRIRESNGFAYAGEQAAIGKFLIDLGIRLDYLHFDYQDKLAPSLPAQGKAIVSPKLNIQYTVNPRLQLYMKSGKGFHSNDSRVVVANKGNEILPAAWGADLGLIWKPTDRLLLNIAAWYLYLQQEFVYAGDDGNIEPSGRTQRTGIDVIARYQFGAHWFATMNLNAARARYLDETKGEDYVPLAPRFTSTGGIFYKASRGFNGGISYRYMTDRPANEDNTIVAKGYFVTDASVNFTRPRYELGLIVENLFNTSWNEAQFATESRLKGEPAPVTELNFTPGTPFFARLKLAVFF